MISTLCLKNISKKYGAKLALDNFSIEFTNGVYGILGPNGAGKTTLINIIVGLLNETSGSISFDGIEMKKLGNSYFDNIGYLPQSPRFYKYYKCFDFMMYMCALKGISKSKSKERCEELLKSVNLWNDRNKKVGAFSGGMLQRLGIAQAMINDPKILILDEPTAGLDPKERIRFRNIISRISADRIVLLATHIVPDIEYIANEVILIKGGVKISQDTPSNLMDSIEGKVFLQPAYSDEQVNSFMQRYSISNVVREKNSYMLRIISNSKPTEEAVEAVPNLEDVYLYYFEEIDYSC